jgi:hypothetical protein
MGWVPRRVGSGSRWYSHLASIIIILITTILTIITIFTRTSDLRAGLLSRDPRLCEWVESRLGCDLVVGERVQHVRRVRVHRQAEVQHLVKGAEESGGDDDDDDEKEEEEEEEEEDDDDGG